MMRGFKTSNTVRVVSFTNETLEITNSTWSPVPRTVSACFRVWTAAKRRLVITRVLRATQFHTKLTRGLA